MRHKRFGGFKLVPLLTTVFGFAMVGVVILIFAHAAGPFVSMEAESGTLTGSVTKGTDTTASAGSYVRFGSATPSAVASMTLSNPTTNTMVLTWTAPTSSGTSAVTAYKIGWTEAGTGRIWDSPAPHYQLSDSPLTLTGLIANTSYSVRVTPINASGDGVMTTKTLSTATVTPPPTTGNLPTKVVGGYFTNWEARNGVTLRSIVDSTNYNVIYVAFAVGTSSSSGALSLDLPPGATTPADFKSQVAYANSKGKKVILSVGGYYDLGYPNIGYRLDSTTKVDQFMTSMRTYQSTWGFNGMDWDLEQGERPYDKAGIIDASRRMRTEFGSSWIICFAPGINLSTWVGTGGVLDTLGPNGWDAIGEQIYDLGYSESQYLSKIKERMTAIAAKYGASKTLLGNKYKNDTGTSLADPYNAFVDILTTKSALNDLRAAGTNIRGSFHWTIQGDSDIGPYNWAGANGVGGDVLTHP